MNVLSPRISIGLFTIWYFILAGSCNAQQKVDIQGFYPGMDMSLLGQTLPPPLRSTCIVSQIDDQRFSCGSDTTHQSFEFYSASALSPPVVWRVTYRFQAATDDNALISNISSTYKKERMTNYVGQRELEVILTDRWFSNGVVVWRLTDRILLALTRRESVPGGTATYLLTVWDSQLDQQNKIAIEDLNKKNAPVPKF
jgi:hypothetical protein